MKVPTQKCSGALYRQGGRVFVFCQPGRPVLFLRFALPVRDSASIILPALILDDWGKEIRGLDLYEWLREHGPLFPRAEVFGFDLAGEETQYFLRELDLALDYPCFAYISQEAPLSAGIPLEGLIQPLSEAPGAIGPALQRVKRPAHLEGPLRSARVSWWQVNPLLLSEAGFSPLPSERPAGS